MPKYVLSIVLIGILLVFVSGGGLAAQPPRPTVDALDWKVTQGNGCGFSGVADILCAFNYARGWEEGQLHISLPQLTMPSQDAWDEMTDGQRALWLVNQERTARGVAPLHGVEENVTAVAQAYAELLLEEDFFKHYYDGDGPWDRLHDNPAIGDCYDFLPYAENLAVFVTLGTSIALPVERSVYLWMYTDAGSNWGHRDAILYGPYTENSGPTGMEGFFGIGRAGGGPYQGPFSSSWNFAELIVMNVFDPCPDWEYEPSPPEAVTGSADHLIDNLDPSATVSVEFSGTVNPRGADTQGYFEYWRLSAPQTVMMTPFQDVGSAPAPVRVVAAAGGLDGDTAYAFRIVADNGFEEVLGASVEFNTHLSYADDQVDGDGCGGFSPCWPPYIQQAVENSVQGATVRVQWGDYLEDWGGGNRPNVTVYRNVILHLGLDETYLVPAALPTVIRPGTAGEPTLSIESGKVIAWHAVLQ